MAVELTTRSSMIFPVKKKKTNRDFVCQRCFRWQEHSFLRISLHNFACRNRLLPKIGQLVRNFTRTIVQVYVFRQLPCVVVFCVSGNHMLTIQRGIPMGFSFLGCGTIRQHPFRKVLSNVQPSKNLHISLFGINHTFVSTTDQYRGVSWNWRLNATFEIIGYVMARTVGLRNTGWREGIFCKGGVTERLVLSAWISKRAFTFIWTVIHDDDPPFWSCSFRRLKNRFVTAHLRFAIRNNVSWAVFCAHSTQLRNVTQL